MNLYGNGRANTIRRTGWISLERMDELHRSVFGSRFVISIRYPIFFRRSFEQSNRSGKPFVRFMDRISSASCLKIWKAVIKISAHGLPRPTAASIFFLPSVAHHRPSSSPIIAYLRRDARPCVSATMGDAGAREATRDARPCVYTAMPVSRSPK
jgi:hypothetical protein